MRTCPRTLSSSPLRCVPRPAGLPVPTAPTQRGNFGLLVCRTIADKNLFAARFRDTAGDGRGFIVGLDDADLTVLVAARKVENGPDPLRLLRPRFNALVN